MADQLGNVVKEGLQVLPELHKHSFFLTLCTQHRQTEAEGERETESGREGDRGEGES